MNAITARDSYPLLRMDKRIDSLREGRIFSTLDTNSSNWKIEIDKRDWEKTAFKVIMDFSNLLECLLGFEMLRLHFNEPGALFFLLSSNPRYDPTYHH